MPKQETKKIAINICYGGFSLSKKACDRLTELTGVNDCCNGNKDVFESHRYNIPRDDENLIKVVEELGEEASGSFSKLSLVDIPSDVLWEIEDFDGRERISERHRTWR